MPYWIHRNGENVGPYDLPQLQEMLAGGQATADDLAIEEGASTWSTVGDLAGSVPPPAAKPMMAELVSPSPVQEPALETANETSQALQAAAAGSGKLKFAIIGLAALLVIGGGVFAYTQLSSDDGDAQKQAQNKPNDTNPTKLPEPPSNPSENSPEKLKEVNASNPGNNLPAPLPPPVINLPVIQPGNELVAGPAPKAVNHIPANAIGVASINLGQLLQKAGGYEALLDKVMQAAGLQGEANGPMIKNMAGLFAPDKLAANFGIGINEPLLGFATDDMKVGVLLPVADAKKLELAIPNVAVMLEAELPDLQPADGYKYIVFPQQASAVALGPNAMMVLIDTKAAEQGQPKDLTRELDQMMKLPSAGGGQLAQVSPHFSKHVQMPYDGALWLNVKELIKVAGNDMPPEAQEFIGNPEILGEKFEFAAGMSFQQGRIVTEVMMGYDEKLVGDWSSGANLDAGILDAIPGNTIAVLTQSMNMDVIRPFVKARVPGETVEEINAVLANFGLNWDALINLPNGDLALSFLGLKEEEPQILLSMNLSDPSKANEVLDKIKASPLYEGMQQSGFDAMIKGNILHITPLSLKDAVESGQNGNPLNFETQQLLGENDSALYFNQASLSGAVPMDPAVMPIVQQFKGVNVIVNAEATGQRFTATINMADPNANVLQMLVNVAFQQAMAAQKALEEMERELQGQEGFPSFPLPPNFGEGDGEKSDEDSGADNNSPNPSSPFPLPPGLPPAPPKSDIKIPQPTTPSPFPPTRPTFGKSKEKAAPPPTPAPAVPEVNPFNPK